MMGGTVTKDRANLAPLPVPGIDDLTREECIAGAIRKAFPLPASGAFTDLLAAIDDEPVL